MTTVPILEDADRVPGRPDITAWRRAARLHQHLWREQHGWPAGAQRRPARLGGGSRPVGTLVDADLAREKGTNFVHPSAFDAAVERAELPQPFQTLDDVGLFTDLLNPTALACNLFGPLWADESLATAALERWFRDVARRDQRCAVQFDWSPGRRNRRWLDDTTAFDAAFLLESADDRRLVGMSVRYHEHPVAQPVVTGSPERSLVRRPGERLLEVTHEAELFRGDDWLDRVFGTELERIWRAHALAHACAQLDPALSSVLFVLVAPAGNPAWAEAADRYGKLLTSKARATFAFRTIDELVRQAGSLLPHAGELKARYLDAIVSSRAVGVGGRATGQQLYVIGEVDGLPAVKFGVSDRPRSRMSDVATGNPRELELLYSEAIPHARWVEYQLREVLAPWRLATNPEWFDVRHLAGDDWQVFVERAIAGVLPDAAPSPVPAGLTGHELLYVDGKVKTFRPVCTCGWRGPGGTIRESLGEFATHLDVSVGGGADPTPLARTS